MIDSTGGVLIVTVAAVGILHTIVPDHWAPIVILARQQGWSLVRTAKSAALAGVGHFTTTLLLGALLWLVGATVAVRYAHLVSLASAIALLGFGFWIAYQGWREMQTDAHGAHGHTHFEHTHLHEHADGLRHMHRHEHHEADWHDSGGEGVLHVHDHAASGRTALLLILGSSPMIEGIPAFLAASTKGVGLLAVMAAVFGIATIATYVVLCLAGVRGLQRTSLGPLERYGEVISGLFVAVVGIYALLTA